ncbi:MAG TPA: hypothetical protein VEM40_14780 [Nitrospirota bacterium]|nr:hypothetical protein [Nitrospirota bacterium]
MRAGTREGVEPVCPFCRSRLDRPTMMRISSVEEVLGGTCAQCGALYVVDPTSKNVGEAMMQALGMAAVKLSKETSEMVAGQDYDDAILSYDWRTHRSPGPPRGFMDGHGRLYIIKIKR